VFSRRDRRGLGHRRSLPVEVAYCADRSYSSHA
jgi:hypothetical protein